MSAILNPTASLRLVGRVVIVPTEPGADMLASRGADAHESTVLQQRFLSASEQEVWQDVPHAPPKSKTS